MKQNRMNKKEINYQKTKEGKSRKKEKVERRKK